MKGTYVLLMKLAKDSEIRTGSLGKIKFRKGFYAYVGSGMNSLEKRIERHLKKKKKKFWHIDYFLERARMMKVIYRETGERTECRLAKGMAERFEKVGKFGCSDCSCPSHLFYSESRGKLEKETAKIIRSLRGPWSPLHTAKSPASWT